MPVPTPLASYFTNKTGDKRAGHEDLVARISAHITKRHGDTPEVPHTGDGSHIRATLSTMKTPETGKPGDSAASGTAKPGAPAVEPAKADPPKATAPAKVDPPKPKEKTLADHATEHGFGSHPLFGGGHSAWVPHATYDKIKDTLPTHKAKKTKNFYRVHTTGTGKGPITSSVTPTMTLLGRISLCLDERTPVMRAGWDAPAKSLEHHGAQHNFDVMHHPKGGHVALVSKDTYHKIRHTLPPHAASPFGDHVRVRTPGKSPENSSVVPASAKEPIEEVFGAGRWRAKGGRFASIRNRGGASWHPDVPKKLGERVKSLGGKMKSAGTGGGYIIAFESHEKALAARTALMAEGWRIQQHDVPGVLLVHGNISESTGTAAIAADKPTVVRAVIRTTESYGPLTKTWDRFRSAAIIAGAGAVHIEEKARAYSAHFWPTADKVYGEVVAAHNFATDVRTTMSDFATTAALGEDRMPGGKGDDRPDSDFDAAQLAMGIKVEMEHTDDPEMAKEIAKDHLSEDPHYYTKLAKAGLVDESGKRVNWGVLPIGESTCTASSSDYCRAKALPDEKVAMHVGYSKWSMRVSDSLHNYLTSLGGRYMTRDRGRGASIYHFTSDDAANKAADYMRGRGHAVALSQIGEAPQVHVTTEKKFQPFTGVPKLSDVVHVAKKLGAEVTNKGGDVLLYHPSWGEKLRIHSQRGDATREILHHVNRMIRACGEPGATATKLTCAVTALSPATEAAYDENFTKVFDDEDEAEDVAKDRSAEAPNSTPVYVIAVDDGTFLVMSGDAANSRMSADDAKLHAIYVDGDEVSGDPAGKDDEDDDLDERHSVRAKVHNQLARGGLAKGHMSRNKNARQSARARRRRGSIYAAKKAARKALHHPDSH